MNIGTDDIAKLLGCTRRYATDVITKQPWFPKPTVDVSQRLRRWDEEAVKLALSGRKS